MGTDIAVSYTHLVPFGTAFLNHNLSESDIAGRSVVRALVSFDDAAENMLVPLAQHILLEQILRNIVAVVLIAALLGRSLVVVALGEHDDIAAGAGINDCGVTGLSVGAL